MQLLDNTAWACIFASMRNKDLQRISYWCYEEHTENIAKASCSTYVPPVHPPAYLAIPGDRRKPHVNIVHDAGNKKKGPAQQTNLPIKLNYVGNFHCETQLLKCRELFLYNSIKVFNNVKK